MRLSEKCPHCGKPAEIKQEYTLAGKHFYILKCKHSIIEDKKNVLNVTQVEPSVSIPVPDVSNYQVLVSDLSIKIKFDEQAAIDTMEADGKPLYDEIPMEYYSLNMEYAAYPFQRDGIKFARSTGWNCLIADAMGLGKTVQALISIKLAKKRTLVCVKGSTIFQWCKEAKCWLNSHPMGIMPIMSRECIIPGFDIYVISIDFLSRKGVLEKLLALGFEMVVVDECQNFKDAFSKRTRALINLIQHGKIRHKILLSGTPIKNRANEYFVFLNLLDPRHFHSYKDFCQYWLIPNEKGIYTRIDPMMVNQFREVTKNYIIRREKEDVLTNLPKLTRDYRYYQIEDENVKNSYNNELDLFQNFLMTGKRVNSTVLLGWLAKMRAITGQGKIPFAIEYATDFLDETEDSLAIGIHHKNVRDVLKAAMTRDKIVPLSLSGEDNVYRKAEIQDAFNSGKNRLLVINAIAGGVGLNLQTCANAVVLERQWNSADEEQFEARFHRDGQKKPVTVVYPIAEGTIDEWFHDMVKNKRKVFSETMGDKHSFDLENDEEMLRALVDKTLANKL